MRLDDLTEAKVAKVASDLKLIYSGDPEGYQFKGQQKRYYDNLKTALARVNTKFDFLQVWERIQDGNPVLTFKAYIGNPEDPDLVWHKYEGKTSGGGQNC